MNQLVGPEVFDELDRQMRASIERHHAKGALLDLPVHRMVGGGRYGSGPAVVGARHESPSLLGTPPVRSFDVRIDKGAYEPFIAQMRKFGETFGFRMLIKPGSPLPYDMYFQMWRHDVKLLAANDSDTGATDLKFGVGFYPKRGEPLPSPENIAPLTEGLLRFLAEVPGASISDATPAP